MCAKLQKLRQPSSLWWVDKNKQVITDLQKAARSISAPSLFHNEPLILCTIVKADNRVFAPTIPRRLEESSMTPARARGVIIADDNGMDVPLDGIRQVAARSGQCANRSPQGSDGRVEIRDLAASRSAFKRQRRGTCLMRGLRSRSPLGDGEVTHISSFKQVWGFWDKYPDRAAFRETGQMVGSFAQIFSTIPKTKWLMSRPFRSRTGHGRDHCVLFGTHLRGLPPIAGAKWGLPDMYLTDSEDGRALLASVERRGALHA
jgi:hypothetical protein